MDDLTVSIGDHRLVVRAAAIVVHGTRTLLCRGVSDRFRYLPGGRVKAGETAVEAIERELTEELTCDFEVVRALAFAENFFVMNGTRYQELGTYFVARLHGRESDVPSREGDELREWVDIERAVTLGIKPDFVASLLTGLDKPFRLISNRDGGGTIDVKIEP
jgi:ADP-ribose pyrophosphatase YjhB (NUDIX family)